MNAKQQALYDRIVAAGGQMWIEATRKHLASEAAIMAEANERPE